MDRDPASRFCCDHLKQSFKVIIPYLEYTPEELKQETFLDKIQVISLRTTFLFIFNFVDYPQIDVNSFLSNLKTLKYEDHYDAIFHQEQVNACPVYILFSRIETAIQLVGLYDRLSRNRSET